MSNTIRLILAVMFLVTSPPYLFSMQDTVNIGAYVRSLYDFNLSDNTIKADIYYWCTYNNRDFDFEHEFEVINANSVSLQNTSVDTTTSRRWFYTKATAQVRQNYELTSYPFDVQKFVISVESSEYDTTGLIFIADKANCKLAPTVASELDEWDIVRTDFNQSVSTYHTNFGNPDSDENSSNSRFDIVVELKRKDSMLILFKLITGILVAFIISCCVFFIKPINTDPRFGLCVGGLFAAIGNKYIVESIVPSTNEVSMLDNLHSLTFIFIFIIIVLSVISLHIYERGDDRDIRVSRRLDLIALIIVVASYSSGVFYFIAREL